MYVPDRRVSRAHKAIRHARLSLTLQDHARLLMAVI
jgi:ribosomal protein L32